MSDTDLSVVVTAHDETVVSRSDHALRRACGGRGRGRGYRVETILALDNATPATSDYFHQPRFDHWERWEMDERDLGRARNAIVPRTKGRYIAFLDADDLFSENWLAEGIAALDAAAERGERAIAHPELNVVFDGSKAIRQNIDSSSSLFRPAPSLRAQLLRLLVHVAARGASSGPVRPSRHPKRSVVPRLAVRDRDTVARVASPRRAGHDHLQTTA